MQESFNKLENHRFDISGESLEIMKKERAYFEDMKKEIPELAGITFFGSRTVNLEKEDSDLDTFLFYDSSPAWELKDSKFEVNQHKKDDIKSKIYEKFNFDDFNYEKNGEHTMLWLIDLSSYNINNIVDKFQKLIRDQESHERKEFSKESVPTESWSIASFFLLGVGDKLYKARGEIFDILEKLPDGQNIWEKIVDYISVIEREKTTKKRGPLVSYNNYPRTISDAREYFNNQQF